MTTENNGFNQPTAGQADWDASLNGNFTINDRGFNVIGQAGAAVNTGHVLWQNSGGFFFHYNPNSLAIAPTHFAFTAAASGDSMTALAWGAVRSLAICSPAVPGKPLYVSVLTPGVVVGSGVPPSIGFGYAGYGVLFNPQKLAAASAAATTLAGLTDVNTNGVTSGSVLSWTNASSKWVAAAPSAGATGYPFLVPTSATLSQAYEDASRPATVVYSAGFGFTMAKFGGGAAADSVAFRGQAIPSAPWTLLIRFDAVARAQFARFGIGLTNGTRFVGLVRGAETFPQDNLFVGRWNDAVNSFSAVAGTARSISLVGPLWLKVTGTGSQHIYEYSSSPLFWANLHTEATSAFLNPTHVGLLAATFNNAVDSLSALIANVDYYFVSSL